MKKLPKLLKHMKRSWCAQFGHDWGDWFVKDGANVHRTCRRCEMLRFDRGYLDRMYEQWQENHKGKQK